MDVHKGDRGEKHLKDELNKESEQQKGEIVVFMFMSFYHFLRLTTMLTHRCESQSVLCIHIAKK